MIDGYIEVDINGEKVGLLYTMWANEKIANICAERPESTMWKTVAMVAAGYFNNCRYKKEAPKFTTSDIELYVDGLYSSEEGKNVLINITNTLTDTYAYKSLTEEAKKKS